MKIFPKPLSQSSVSKKPVTENSLGKRKEVPTSVRPELSKDEIREKVAAHVALTNSAKKPNPIDESQKLGSSFMNPEVIEKKDHLLQSDVQKNDPSDSNTSEKLKSVLAKGAFNFNGREKEVLEKILAGSN